MTVDADNETAYFPPAPFSGPAAARAWAAAVDAKSASPTRIAAASPTRIAAASPTRIAAASPALSSYGATGFTVADRGGMAVSCVLSMGQMFGSGQAMGAAGDAGSRVTGVVCPDGAPSKVDNCTLPIDPRGAGVSRAIGMEIGDPKAKIRF